MDEFWKPVKNFEGIYEVSSRGRIRVLDRIVATHPGQKGTIRKGHILLPGTTRIKGVDSYPFVYLTKDGQKRRLLVHRVVAEAFIPNPDNKLYVDHIDTNTLNNNVENLRWVTSLENQNNPLTKLHLSCFSRRKKRVGMFSTDGKLLESFASGTEAARQMRARGLKTNEHIILQICNKRPMKCRDGKYRQRKTTAGFVWKFI